MEQPLILDRYRPLSDLGEGGHGSVTLAFDTKMARRVAVKRLPLPAKMRGRAPVGLAEARTAAMLNHPNVVTVYEWDTDPDEAFIIMEHVDGASLAEIIDSRGPGPLDDDETAAVMEAVCSAVAFAHENGVLHLDLKPDNVLVGRDGSVKVADFGIAELVGGGLKGSGGTGTPGYMSPEQLHGEDVDERSDEWALAAVAYECIAAANPFLSRSAEGAAFKLDFADIPAPSDFQRDIAPDVEDVVLAALDADPDCRYGSVRSFENALLPKLGDPSEGRRSLAAAAAEISESEETAELQAVRALGMWDRAGRLGDYAMRVGYALVCGVTVWATIEQLAFGTNASTAVAVIAALTALLAPGLGLAVSLLALAVVEFTRIWTLGLVVLALSAVFWLLSGRKGGAGPLAALASPLLTSLHVPFAAPIIAGFALDPLEAAVCGAASYLLGIAFRSLWASRPLYPAGPVLILTLLAWTGAAVAMSLFSMRATRFSAALGAVASSAILVLGYWAASVVSDGAWPSVTFLQLLAGSLILVAIVIVAGAPVRGEPG